MSLHVSLLKAKTTPFKLVLKMKCAYGSRSSQKQWYVGLEGFYNHHGNIRIYVCM